MARLGKRERAIAKANSDVMAANLANMSALHMERKLFGLSSCADPAVLKARTTHGYRDNLHGRYQPKPSRAMAVPDRENMWKAPKR